MYVTLACAQTAARTGMQAVDGFVLCTGILPLNENVQGPGIPDPEMPAGTAVPQYVSNYSRPTQKLNGAS